MSLRNKLSWKWLPGKNIMYLGPVSYKLESYSWNIEWFFSKQHLFLIHLNLDIEKIQNLTLMMKRYIFWIVIYCGWLYWKATPISIIFYVIKCSSREKLSAVIKEILQYLLKELALPPLLIIPLGPFTQQIQLAFLITFVNDFCFTNHCK